MGNNLQKIVADIEQLKKDAAGKDGEAEALRQELEQFEIKNHAAQQMKDQIMELLQEGQGGSAKDREVAAAYGQRVEQQRAALDEVRERLNKLTLQMTHSKDLRVKSQEQ